MLHLWYATSREAMYGLGILTAAVCNIEIWILDQIYMHSVMPHMLP